MASTMSRQTIARDFRRIDPTRARVILFEGGNRVLHSFPASLSQRAETSLRRMGVEVRTSAVVTKVTPAAVWLGSKQIRARAVISAAGVRAASLTRTLGVPLDRSGRIPVEADLSIPGHPESFAVGDVVASLPQGDERLPDVVPVAEPRRVNS
jgi:NADH dehydrogenase